MRYAVIGSVILLGLDVAFAVLLDPQPAGIATDLVSTVAEIAVTTACFWTARRARGGDRRWRLFIGFMAAGATVASLATAATLLGGGSPAARVPWGYAVLLAFYVVALAGLLSLPTDPVDGRSGEAGRAWRGPHRWHAITLLDCALIVGSIVLLEWGTVLAAVIRAGGPGVTQFQIGLVHTAALLILAAAVMLIASFRRPRSPATLALLGTGLLTHGLTTNAIIYRVAHGRLDFPAWPLVTYTLAYLLILLAALVPLPSHVQPDSPAPMGPRAMWAHAALPYAVLGAASLLVLGKLLTGAKPDRVETYGVVALLLVALVRQMVTLAENTRLLAEVRERERELRHQAFHDPLTGLANRALFTERLKRAFAQDIDDAPGGAPLSVLFLDLDQFKRVNDTFGHAAGDDLLEISARRLRAGTRAMDTVARLGGDEFAVILGGGGPEDPRRVGERLATALQAPCLLAGRPYTPRASFGLVALDRSAKRTATPDTLLQQADQAMYTAKRARAGKLVVYRPDLAAPGEPDAALDIRYRPVVDLRDGQMAAVRADLRAEPTSTPTTCLLERVCRDLADYRREAGARLAVLVEVTPDRAGEDRLVTDVVDILRRHDLPATSMILSLAGMDQLPDIAAAKAVFKSLADHGIRLAVANLDDSECLLAALRLLPVRVAILHPDLATIDERRAALRTTIRTAAQVGIPAVATAADDRRRVRRLIEEGCAFAEGRCYGDPSPLADLHAVHGAKVCAERGYS